MKVGFVVPCLNNYHGALELINSIRTDFPHQVYVIDQYRHQRPLSGAWNEGFRKAVADGCEHIFILNDDILLGPDSVENTIKEYERLKDERIILVSLLNLMGKLDKPEDILSLPHDYRPGEIEDHPNYSCFMVGKDFFDKVGSFDENFNPAWCEDQDSHQRIVMLGYRAVCTTAAQCVHIGQVSTNLAGPPNSGHSEDYFRKKWGSRNPNPPQAFPTPYNDPKLTAKDWIVNYG